MIPKFLLLNTTAIETFGAARYAAEMDSRQVMPFSAHLLLLDGCLTKGEIAPVRWIGISNN